MDEGVMQHDQNVDEEEYVLLDLDDIYRKLDIPRNAPYVLSGLDTMNPVLVIGDKLKLINFENIFGGIDARGVHPYPGISIGKYEETIGTCLIFTEEEGSPVAHQETGPSEANLFTGRLLIDPNQSVAKQVRPMASLEKVLKFRLLIEDEDIQNAAPKPSTL